MPMPSHSSASGRMASAGSGLNMLVSVVSTSAPNELETAMMVSSIAIASARL